MSDKGGNKSTPMDEAAKERIMSAEYKKNDGQATDWSKRAQSAADKNSQTISDKGTTPMDEAAKERIMTSEYKKNDGQATDWSRRAQSAADKNEFQKK